MEITGKVVLDLPIVEGQKRDGSGTWKKKEWVLEYMSGSYPRKVVVQAFNDRADRLMLEIGKTYTVSVDPESREYNGKWYTNLTAFAAHEVTEQVPNFGPAPAPAPGVAPAPAPAPAASYPSNPFGAAPEMPGADASDDLPF